MTISSTVTLPAFWACALVNGDYSGMDDDERERCQAAEHKLADEGWNILSDVEDSERFTWSYALYDAGAGCSGGSVLDYVILKSGR